MWDVNQWWTQKTEKAQAGKPFILNRLVTDLTMELLIITVPVNIINITYLPYLLLLSLCTIVTHPNTIDVFSSF
jgi:hypothetical protein